MSSKPPSAITLCAHARVESAKPIHRPLWPAGAGSAHQCAVSAARELDRAQVEAGAAHLAEVAVVRAAQVEGAADRAQADRRHAGFLECQELAALAALFFLARAGAGFRRGRVGHPHPQLAEDRVAGVDPAVAVGIEGQQFAEAVAGLGAEQLAAVVDAAIGVAVEGEETAA
jgi:hypothetical protein